MKYKSVDGIIIEGNNSRELIQNLRSQSMFPELTLTAYMNQVSANVKMDSQKVINPNTYDEFTQDLINAEYIELIEE